MIKDKINQIIDEIKHIPKYKIIGKIIKVKGLLLEAIGLEKFAKIGSRCQIITDKNLYVKAEVIGVDNDHILLMPFDTTVGIGIGSKVHLIDKEEHVYPSIAWLGRVIDGFGNPIDGKGPLIKGNTPYTLHNSAPPAHMRKRIGNKINTGIRAINTFLSCCEGQRIGIFAGSGVGKSMMMAMITKFAQGDIKIIGLIGERGREVHEFLHDYLGAEGLSKAIVVVATSDEPALTRRQATYLTITIAEYFRDLGMDVICMIDNITRFAMAQRDIGLAGGEPPITKGYPPSVFSILPQLLERAGPGIIGSITGLFSVLVENDDNNEIIADTVRGILDGHIVLDRSIARMGIYPAINIIDSISRTMPRCNTTQENNLINRAKRLFATYIEMADMIKIGAYKKGIDPEIDEAIKYYPAINNFISQSFNDKEDLESSYKKLAAAIDYSFE